MKKHANAADRRSGLLSTSKRRQLGNPDQQAIVSGTDSLSDEQHAEPESVITQVGRPRHCLAVVIAPCTLQLQTGSALAPQYAFEVECRLYGTRHYFLVLRGLQQQGSPVSQSVDQHRCMCARASGQPAPSSNARRY